MIATLARPVTVGPHRNRVTFPAGTKLQSIAAKQYVTVDIPAVTPLFAQAYVGCVVTLNSDVLVPTAEERKRVLAELVSGYEYL